MESRISIAHKPKNADIVHFDKLSLLSPTAFYSMICYDMNSLRNYLSVSPSWYNAVLQSFDDAFNKVENKFAIEYSSYLLFTNSYTSSSQIKCCQSNGIKVDRVFSCECLENCKGRTVTIGCTYSYYGEKERHFAEYQFECNPFPCRVMWIHKNECFFSTGQNQEQSCAYCVPVPQVRVGDQIEIAVSCSSLRGVVDVDTILWNPIKLSEIYQDDAITYNKEARLHNSESSVYTKLVADLSRICEEEDAEIDWSDINYCSPNERRKLFSLSLLESMFTVNKAMCSGVDVIISKYFLIASVPQMIDERVLGIGVKIVNESECCVVEVKKLGLLIDRNRPMEMRVGDVLVFYFTKD